MLSDTPTKTKGVERRFRDECTECEEKETRSLKRRRGRKERKMRGGDEEPQKQSSLGPRPIRPLS